MSDFAAPIAGGFDPTLEPLDLTKDEKLRTTAIMLAISAWEKMIIQDSSMYKAIMKEKPETIVPAHEDRVMEMALKFAYFIESGQVLLKGMILRVQIPEDENGPENGNGEATQEDPQNGS